MRTEHSKGNRAFKGQQSIKYSALKAVVPNGGCPAWARPDWRHHAGCYSLAQQAPAALR